MATWSSVLRRHSPMLLGDFSSVCNMTTVYRPTVAISFVRSQLSTACEAQLQSLMYPCQKETESRAAEGRISSQP